MNYDIIIIGSGPGGYVAAIRASQLGLKVSIVEKAELGGICLNWGCIPTKSLLKSAQVFKYIKNASNYGINVENVDVDFSKIVNRSREIAANMSKGIQYLFKKNKVEVIYGTGKLIDNKTVEITDSENNKSNISANNIILATGARSKELPNLKQDGKKIIGYREALSLAKLPESMIIVGSGAIGIEFAYFYNTLGVKVTLVEFLPFIVPLEDEDVSKQLGRSFKKNKIKVMVKSLVESVDTSGEKCKLVIKTKKGEEIHKSDIVLSAVGITPNIENIGIEELGIETEYGKIKVDKNYQTNVEGVYAIGDIINTPALAHVASAEAINCVEKIAGHKTTDINYKNIPGCIYASPEISSVGLSEKKAKEAGYEINVGKFPYTASGKASSSGDREGFVKLIFDKKTDKLLGAHLIGANVTEMISELVLAGTLDAKANDIIKSVHPHPTMSEAIMEAAAAAYNEVIHI